MPIVGDAAIVADPLLVELRFLGGQPLGHGLAVHKVDAKAAELLLKKAASG